MGSSILCCDVSDSLDHLSGPLHKGEVIADDLITAKRQLSEASTTYRTTRAGRRSPCPSKNSMS